MSSPQLGGLHWQSIEADRRGWSNGELHAHLEFPVRMWLIHLRTLRQEWQASVDGESLIDVQASVGLLLGDVVMMLGLSREEHEAALGTELRREFIQVVRQRYSGNG